MIGKQNTRTVGYWPLQESSGQAKDYSGNENHATTTNVTNYDTNGPLGSSSMDFNGSDDYINMGNIPALDTQIFSVSLWVNLDNTTNNSSLYWNNSSDSNRNGWKISYNNSGFYELNIIDSNSNNNAVTWTNNTTDSWVHIVATYDGSTQKLYGNGVERASQSLSITIPYGTDPTQIGRRPIDSDRYTNGKIAHVRIWDYPLTQAQIKALYNAAKSGYAETSRKSP